MTESKVKLLLSPAFSGDQLMILTSRVPFCEKDKNM